MRGGWLGLYAVIGVLVTACGDDGTSGPGGFTGVCLGAERQFYDDSVYGDACTAHFNSEAVCGSVDGCEWTAGTYCRGYPRPCQQYSRNQCASLTGCRWYSPQECADEAACNELMYVDHGGCSVVPDYTVGTCSGSAYIDLDLLCRGVSSRVPPLDC